GYPASADFDPAFTFTRNAGIGATGDRSVASFFGSIDDLTIYNRALTPEEMQALYHAAESSPEKSAAEITSSGLIHQWHADGDARDSVGTNDGWMSSGVGFAPGRLGQAFHFDGLDACVKIPGVQDLNGAG